MGKRVYEIVSEKIVEYLESGVIPWQKCWASEVGPRNFVSNRFYQGSNRLLLGIESALSGCPYWVTFKQCQALGGRVRKGERSSIAVYWDRVEVRDPSSGESDLIPFMKFYRVFRVNQCDGIQWEAPQSGKASAWEVIPACESIIDRWADKPPVIKGAVDTPCYSLSSDRVAVPFEASFGDALGWYSTLFHEFVHSTGHPSRLGREMGKGFGSLGYAREELVAEIGSSFLLGSAGFTGDREIKDAAAYIQSWIGKIQSDPRAFVVAASQAEKAADYILKGGVAVEAVEAA